MGQNTTAAMRESAALVRQVMAEAAQWHDIMRTELEKNPLNASPGVITDHLNEATRLRAALAAHDAAQWQPGETAPRDGSCVLGVFDIRGLGLRVRIVSWEDADPDVQWPGEAGWMCDEGRLSAPQALLFWQHLPTPPAAASDDAAEAQP